MAVTKTKFKNYARCRRYVALDNLKKENLEADISLKQYKEEERKEKINELLNSMTDDLGNDLINVKDNQLETMMPYYNEIEILAGRAVENKFEGDAFYAEKTYAQESFDCKINNIRYLCYVDIYNERNSSFDIIEVKSTTSNKFLNVGKSYKDSFGNKKVNSIFKETSPNIFMLKEEINGFVFDEDFNEKDYMKHRKKLFDKYSSAGNYVYDLAIQRYIIENDLKQNNESFKIDNIKYYLAVLNRDYVFDGKYENSKPIYTDEIISFFDLTKITKEYLEKIDIERKIVEGYIKENDASETKVGIHCEMKKTTKCKFLPICFKKLPEKNSILTYFNNHHGFKDEKGYKHDRFELINDNVLNLLDIPYEWLQRENNIIQYDVVKNNKIYLNKEKIMAGINEITYPIYHLDFETFPCPLPRLKGEKCYTQSVFQFSIHVEKNEGICDKEKDHFEYLAKDLDDHREELIKKMLDVIDVNNKGTVLVYNEAFEKSRIKELSNIFIDYKTDLLKLNEMIFDLMYVVKTKTSLYEELGFDKKDSKLYNYYHNDLNGSYSIKKILPIFTDLTYKGMDVGNGVEALITYANFPKMDEKEYKEKYKALVKYCQQDTWAMVEILKGLKKLVK